MMQDMEVRRMVERQLFNEKLLWIGKPAAASFALNQASNFILTIVVAITFTVLITFLPQSFMWKEDDLVMNGSFFYIVVCAFVLGGVWKVVAQRRRAQTLIYAITNKRAMVLEPNKYDVSVNSINTADNLKRRTLADGKGDLVFGQVTYRDPFGREQRRELGFYGIENVQLVESIVRRALKNKATFS